MPKLPSPLSFVTTTELRTPEGYVHHVKSVWLCQELFMWSVVRTTHVLRHPCSTEEHVVVNCNSTALKTLHYICHLFKALFVALPLCVTHLIFVNHTSKPPLFAFNVLAFTNTARGLFQCSSKILA